MLINIEAQPKIQLLPTSSLNGCGITPYGDPLFRVVWSESRYHLVGGTHKDYDNSAGGYSNDRKLIGGKDPNLLRSQVGYRWYPLYPGVKAWILECWKSPIGFTGCTRERYNEMFKDPSTGLLTIGPYPERGEYSQCFTFPERPGYDVVVGVICRVKAGWNYSFNDHKAAIEKEEETKKKKQFDKFKDIILNSQQAFKNRPSNVRPGKRLKEDVRLKYTAKDVGIHQQGFSTVGGNRARNS